MGNFFLEAVLFIIAVIVCFYFTGNVFFHFLKIKLQGIEKLFLTIVAGLSVFTIILYLLSWINAELLAWPLLLVISIIAFKKNLYKISFEKKEYAPLMFIISCSVIFSTPLMLYGLFGNTISHRFDDLWHLALIQEMKVHFPPDIPTYAGVPLKGYHFFSDFIVAKISNLFFITPFYLFYQFFSIFLSFLWGMGAYTLLYLWSKKVSAAMWAVFLTMFGGSFAYIFHWFGHPEINLQDGLRMLQPAVSLFNPPYTLSVIVLFFCLSLLYKYITTREKRWLIPFIFGAGILPMIKVYAGIILFGGLIVTACNEILKKKYFLIIIFLCIGFLFLITYGLFVLGHGSLIWYPLWPTHQLLGGFSGAGYEEKIATYYKVGVLSKIIPIELWGLFLFLIGNLGTRLFGILALLFLLRQKKRPSNFALSVFVMLLISVLLPLFFIQTGKVFEMIQMTNYYLMFCSLFASLGIAAFINLKFRHKKSILWLTAFIFIVLTIPSAIAMQNSMITNASSRHELSEPRYKALLTLRNQGTYSDTILELPELGTSSTQESLKSWHDYTEPLAAVLSNKRAYLIDGGILFPGMKLEDRLDDHASIINYRIDPTLQSAEKVKEILQKKSIRYIISPYNFPDLEKISGIQAIYTDQYFIYEFINKK